TQQSVANARVWSTVALPIPEIEYVSGGQSTLIVSGSRHVAPSLAPTTETWACAVQTLNQRSRNVTLSSVRPAEPHVAHEAAGIARANDVIPSGAEKKYEIARGLRADRVHVALSTGEPWDEGGDAESESRNADPYDGPTRHATASNPSSHEQARQRITMS